MLPPSATATSATGSTGSDLPSPPVAPDDAPTTKPVRRSSRRATWSLIGVSAVALGYVAVIDPNKPNLVPGCAFKALTGLDCPGCGGTRAVHALLHGDIANAINHNVLAVIAIVVGVIWLAWNSIAPRFGRSRIRFTLTTRWGIGLVIAVSAFWLLRNLPIEPLSWFGSGN